MTYYLDQHETELIFLHYFGWRLMLVSTILLKNKILHFPQKTFFKALEGQFVFFMRNIR